MKKIFLIISIFIFLPLNVKALEFDISSKNAFMINLNTNEVIYEKNKDEKVEIASLQKIMTALIAIENIDNLYEEVVIKEGEFDSLDKDLAVMGLKSGEVITYYDLLCGTLLKSGADAAYALSIEISGSEEAYVNIMNEKVKELGLVNTNFKNVTGLDLEGQFSTAYDIGIIFKYALKNKVFREIITKYEYTTSDDLISFSSPRKKANNLNLNYFIGGKTGYTNRAGLCLASYIINKNEEFILITLGADYNIKNKNYLDQKEICDFFINNYSYRTVLKKGDLITSIRTKYNKTINIYSKKDIMLYLENKISEEEIYIKYKGKNNLDKSYKQNDKIGEYYIMYKNNILYKDNIYLDKDINYNLNYLFIIPVFILLLLLIKLIKKI